MRRGVSSMCWTQRRSIFGLSPLVFNPGSGTELYRGLGAIVLFGLLFSTLITLTFIPSLLSLTLELGERLGARRRRDTAPDAPIS